MYRGWTQTDYQNKHYNINQKDEGTQDDRGRDGGTNFILRTKEQETRLTLQEHDDDDDENQLDALISQIYFGNKITCFGQFLCPSSGVFYYTYSNDVCHTGLLIRTEKLVHLVGFIIRIYHDAGSPVRHVLVYFVSLYMFRLYLGPSSAGTPYVYNNWYLYFIDQCLLA